MSKIAKKILSTLLVFQMFTVTNVFATSNQEIKSVDEYINSISDEEVNLEARELFITSLPESERDVFDLNDKEIVNEIYSFYKFELKDEAKEKDTRSLTEDDYNIVPSSLGEFKLANAMKFRNQVAPGIWDVNDFDSIVMTGLTIIRDTNDNRNFNVTTNFTWSTPPRLKFTDAVGITCSANFSPIESTRDAYAHAITYIAYNEPIHDNIIEEYPKIDPQGRGVAMSIKPLPSAQYNTGYLSCDFRFNNNIDDYGTFTSEYLKTNIQVGSLSFDTSGRPSLGIVLGGQRFSNALNVTKY